MNEKEYILVDPIELLPKQSVARFDLDSDHIEDDFRDHLSYLYQDCEFRLFRTRCFYFCKPIGLPDRVLTLTSRSGWLCMAHASFSLAPALRLADVPFVKFNARNPQLKFAFNKGETGVAFKVIDEGKQIVLCCENLCDDVLHKEFDFILPPNVNTSGIYGLHLETVSTIVDWAISNNTNGVYKVGFEGACGKSVTAAAIAYQWEKHGVTFGYMCCDNWATPSIINKLNKTYGCHLKTVLTNNIRNKGDVLFVEHFNPSGELLKKLKAKWNIIVILNDDNYTVQE